MSSSLDSTRAADGVMAELRRLLAELHPEAAHRPTAELDSRFDQELGLDSLSRLELVARCERRFALSLPGQSLNQMVSARDLVRALLSRGSSRQRHVDELRALPESVGESDGLPLGAASLPEVLDWHCARHPERCHLQMDDGERAGLALSYGELRRQARCVAQGLANRGITPGEPVALMLPTEADYFPCFLGILLAGGIPTPLYPPAHYTALADYLERQLGILDNCQARLLLVPPVLKARAGLVRSLASGLRALVTPEELLAAPEAELLPCPAPGDIALLQYTSGSTAAPKGVILSHAQLLANIRAMGQAAGARPNDVFVSWLPLYHDMGLIGAWLGSLYHGCLLVLMAPQDFLARPARWLWALHRYRGTISAAPNFAYELCLTRIAEEELQGLDLSAWRLAFNGAEPVSPETLQGFQARFAASGLRPDAVLPVYGLAEACLGLSFPPPGRPARRLCVDRDALQTGGRVEPARDDAPGRTCLLSCGLPLPGCELRIADAQNRELPEWRQGRVQFQSPGATSGYYRNPQASARLFQDGWLETGDLGFVAGGELYITGRGKDLIIRAGRNIHPQDLETAIGRLPGMRRGRVAVFGSMDPRQGTERLVVMAETREREAAALQTLRQAVNAVVLEHIAMPPDAVALVPPGSVLKTSSGKLRRAACRELYESGSLGGRRGLARPLARLALRRLWPWLTTRLRDLAALAYAGYAWTWFGLLALPAWLLALLLPGADVRHQALRGLLRLLAFTTGVRLSLEGEERLEAAGTCILAVNHASYVDALVLMALLPRPYAVLAKEELSRHWYLRWPLRRLGAIFVARGDAEQAVAAARRLGAQAEGALLFFVEGTFSRVPGLAPFRMGAFLAAAQSGRSLLPVALGGSRDVLRGSSWFPRPGRIRVRIGPALRREAGGDDWSAALSLRNQARDFILRHCGEPDLEARPPP
ncbi:MAG: AMP-binding protein [Gammaproteobacteria bacterium]|nr:AMP-binding protein [Gammaproteobacteria bacterium]